MEETEQASLSNKQVRFSDIDTLDDHSDTNPLIHKDKSRRNYSAINNSIDDRATDNRNFLNIQDVNEHIFANSFNFSENLETSTDEVINNYTEVKASTNFNAFIIFSTSK